METANYFSGCVANKPSSALVKSGKTDRLAGILNLLVEASDKLLIYRRFVRSCIAAIQYLFFVTRNCP